MLLDLHDLDVTSPAFFSRPDHHEVLTRLRDEAPVCRSTADTWMVTRYDDIRAISRDPARFSSARGVIINDPTRTGKSLSDSSVIHMDPPQHSTYRKIVSPSFTPRSVASLEDTVRETVVKVLDAAPSGTVIDAVETLTAPIPVLVIAALLAVQEGDLGDFRRWSDAMIEYPDSRDREGMKMAGELFGFFSTHVRDRVASPGDDLVSVLAQASFQGESLSMDQILMFCMTLLVAGNETTRHLLSGGMLALDQHPDQKAQLVTEANLMPGACEEMLRWVTPIRAMGRTATADLSFGGADVPAGDYLVMLYASANRDERVWGPTGSVFDVTRPVNTTHVAFGFGEHLCLGAALARLEARVFFEELLARYPRYSIAAEPEWTESTLVNGPKRMPVVLAS